MSFLLVHQTADDKCFVCSIDRFAFEQRLGGFVDHVKTEHNALHYLFYLDYLLKRNTTEYTGLESFVRAHLDARNYDWIPIGRAMHADRLRQFRDKHRNDNEAVDRLVVTMDKLESRMSLLEAGMEEMRAEVVRLGSMKSTRLTMSSSSYVERSGGGFRGTGAFVRLGSGSQGKGGGLGGRSWGGKRSFGRRRAAMTLPDVMSGGSSLRHSESEEVGGRMSRGYGAEYGGMHH